VPWGLSDATAIYVGAGVSRVESWLGDVPRNVEKGGAALLALSL
jgi:hypothetical protein